MASKTSNEIAGLRNSTGEREHNALRRPSPSSWHDGDARGEAHVCCFQCGHPIDDAFKEYFWSDAEDRYIAWCARCQLLHDSVARAMQEVLRRYYEVAIARIPKKKREATAA